MNSKIKESYSLWLENIAENKALHAELADAAEDDVCDMFYKELEFGTAGLRGIMGPGTNRMNIYTVSRASYAFARYLNESFDSPSAVIAFDTRINSEMFAKQAASVLAANGVKAYIFPAIVPTPLLSFAVRQLGCSGGIMVTASHNPKEYNGYKVYGSDGCQIDEEIAGKIHGIMLKTDVFAHVKQYDFTELLAANRITYVVECVKNAFYEHCVSKVIEKDVLRNSGIKVLYTPLNGVGLESVTKVLGMLGVNDVSLVESQTAPDGSFPTCPKPNPEFLPAFSEALKEAEKAEPDLIIATDPDCDRVACAVRHNGEYFFPSGNEIGILFIDYELSRMKEKGPLPHAPLMVCSIVSTPMAEKVAAYHGCTMKKTLTGFKNIAGLIRELDKDGTADNYIFGFEESIGYMFGTFVRDKDAVTSSAVLCEMAAWYSSKGMTLRDALDELYAKHGYYALQTDNYVYEGAEGAQIMKDIMAKFRAEPPYKLGTKNVITITDLMSGDITQNGEVTGKSDIPSSNVLLYELEDGCSAIVRPSGTEPKIKTYCCAVGKNSEEAAEILADICRDMANYCKK